MASFPISVVAAASARSVAAEIQAMVSHVLTARPPGMNHASS